MCQMVYKGTPFLSDGVAVSCVCPHMIITSFSKNHHNYFNCINAIKLCHKYTNYDFSCL